MLVCSIGRALSAEGMHHLPQETVEEDRQTEDQSITGSLCSMQAACCEHGTGLLRSRRKPWTDDAEVSRTIGLVWGRLGDFVLHAELTDQQTGIGTGARESRPNECYHRPTITSMGISFLR